MYSKMMVILLLVGIVFSRVTREDIASLQALDTTGDMDKLSAATQLTLLDSFLELDNEWWIFSRRRRSAPYRPPPPPPPRRRHSPCECDVPQQDAFTNECISRRFNTLMADYNALLSPTAYGFTIESSRSALRTPQIALESAFTDSHGNTSDVIFNMTDPQVGYVPRADRGAKHLLSMEYFWASSVNNAYMNLFTVTNDKFSGSVNGMELSRDSLMDEMSTWFTGLQQDQDNTTLVNLQRVYNATVDRITSSVADMNKQLFTVWDLLNGVTWSLGNATSKSDEVNSAFRASLDSIAGNINNISVADLPNTLTSFVNKMNTVLANSGRAYNTTGSNVISGYTAASNLKRVEFMNSSISTINLTKINQKSLLSNTNKSLLNLITRASDAANATSQGTWKTYYGPSANAVTGNISNASSVLLSQVSTNRGVLTSNSQRQTSIQSYLVNVSSTESRLVTSSKSTSSRGASNKTAAINQIIGNTVSRSAQDLALVNSIGIAAPVAVGSDTFSNLNEMSDQVNAMDAQLGESMSGAAAESQAVGAALSNIASQGKREVDAAGQVVAGNIDSSAGEVFNGAMNVGTELSTGTKTVPSSAAVSTLTLAQANALSAVQTQMDSLVTSSSMSSQADAEAITSQILVKLQQQGISAEDSMVALRAYIAQSGNTNAYSARFASQSDEQIGTFLSGAATSVYNSVVKFTDNMQSAFENFKQKLNVGTSGERSAGIAADAVGRTRTNFDASFTNSSNITDFNTDINGLNQSVTGQTQYVQGQVDNSVIEGQARVASFLATTSSSVSDTTAEEMRQVESIKASSGISIGGFDVSQMGQIRSIAANFDSLMRQVNNLIGSQNTGLYDAIMKLPGKGQTMIQRIRAFNAAADAIQRGDPLGMDDLVKFGIHPDPDISDLSLRVSETAEVGLSNISKISADFTNSANKYRNNFAVLSNSFASTFESLVRGLQADLAAADAAAKSTAPNVVRDAGILSAISRISGQIQDLADKASQVGSGDGLVIPYTQLTDLMSQSAAVVTSASDSASQASDVVNSINDAANEMSQKLISTNNSGTVSELKLHAASLAMQSGVLLNHLNSRETNMNKTQTDSMSVIASYANQAAASASLIAQRDQSVSNAVQIAKANILNSMGQIAAKTAELDTPSRMTSDLTVLRATLSQMIAAFDSYLANQRLRFTAARNQLNSTNANSLFDVQQKLTGLDMDLSSRKTMLAHGIDELQTAMSWFGNDADLKVPADSLRAQLEAWYSKKLKDIGDEKTELSRLSTDNRATEQTVESSLSSAIESMAAEAVSMIQSYQLPVPDKLEDYASNGIEAIAR